MALFSFAAFGCILHDPDYKKAVQTGIVLKVEKGIRVCGKDDPVRRYEVIITPPRRAGFCLADGLAPFSSS
jgi:hypothetical protein